MADEPTPRELIELEVKRAIAGELEAYRNTVEAHQAYLEKATKYFAVSVSTLFAIASAVFVYFFQHSISEAVDKLDVVGEAKNSITNHLADFGAAVTTKMTNAINETAASAQQRAVEGVKDAAFSEAGDITTGRDFRDQIKKSADQALKSIDEMTPTQLARFFNAVPAGTIVAYGGSNVDLQSGWLPCDGKAYSRTDYAAALFRAIGTSWGTGDGTNTFNVPDLRGIFLRGVNGDRSDQFADPEPNERVSLSGRGNSKNSVGSFQVDSVGPHQHAFVGTTERGRMDANERSVHYDHNDSCVPAELQTSENSGKETRPKNAYVNYIIKF